MNLDMTDSMGPGKLVRHMQNPSYTYDKYLICIGLGPSISSVICKNPSYSGPSYPSSPEVCYENEKLGIVRTLYNNFSNEGIKKLYCFNQLDVLKNHFVTFLSSFRSFYLVGNATNKCTPYTHL